MGLSSSKTTSSRDPWKPAQPYITESLGGLQSAYNTSNQNVMQNMPAINSAIQRITNNMNNPPEYSTAAREQLTKTINGDYINANPYTDQVAGQIADNANSQYLSTFGSAGRSRGGLAALLSSQGVANAVGQFRGDQYNRERSLQQQAIMAAPAFNADEYTSISPLLSAINASAQLPLLPAQTYASGIANATGQYGTTTQKQDSNVFQSLLGAAATIGGAALTGGASLGMSGLLGGAGGGLSSGLLGAGLNSMAQSPWYQWG